MNPNDLVIGQKVIYHGFKAGFVHDIQHDVGGFKVAVMVVNTYYKNAVWVECDELEKY